MAEAIYVLCGATSAVCAVMLARAWLASREPLLLWSMVCFVALAVNNVILILDLAVIETMDLRTLRTAAALVGVGSLLAGLIWETA